MTFRPAHRSPNGNGRGPNGRGPNGRGPNGHGARGGGSGRMSYGRSNANLRRIALMRLRAKPRKSGPSGLVPLTLVLVLLVFVGGIAGTAVAGAGAAVATLDEMCRDLPDVARFEELDLAQPSTVYDRTGTVQLARFQSERRRVVTFDEIPPLVLDATIATEDRTFWTNEGYDLASIASAGLESLVGGRDRGASTVTQQFVREAGLLPPEVLDPNQTDVYTRKIKEICQADRLTRAFPGVEGKRRIITAYLNKIYYGHGAYGIAAAAQVYFGIHDLSQLTPAQAAVLAGLPQSPSNYDLYKWASPDALGQLVVPVESRSGERLPIPVERRNFILGNLRAGFGEFTTLSEREYRQTLGEPIILQREPPLVYQAPHFVWHMKQELDRLLIDRAPADRGGYTVITTLNWDAQQLAQKYITAATIFTQESEADLDRLIEENGLEQDREWLGFLRGKGIHNGALVALDARTGDILAHVGSAGYYRDDLESPKLDTKYDVAGQGYRQPGSAWKPMVYAAGFDNGTLTPGTLLFDVTTEFGRDARGPWVPRNATLRDYGPVLARDALYFSLNTTAIRALDMVGVDAVAQLAGRMELTFRGGNQRMYTAGLTGAIGTVEVNMLEYASGFSTFGTGGVQAPKRSILEIRDSNGEVIYRAGEPQRRQVMSPEAAWLVNDILKDNTNPQVNPMFGPGAQIVNGPDDERREAAIKTGTTNELRDLSAYGYVAPPDDPNAPQLMVGVWMGNSDNSPPQGGDQPAYAATGPGRVWRAFMREYTRGQPLATFPGPPDGLLQTDIDAWSGGEPGPYTTDQRKEWFIRGTQPGGEQEVDPAGALYVPMCDSWYIDPTQLYPDVPPRWHEALADWTERARRGTNQRGEHGSSTAYLPTRSSWGREVVPLACPQPTPPPPGPSDDPNATPAPEPQPTPLPPPPPPEPTPQPEPTLEPEPTPEPPPEGGGGGGVGSGGGGPGGGGGGGPGEPPAPTPGDP